MKPIRYLLSAICLLISASPLEARVIDTTLNDRARDRTLGQEINAASELMLAGLNDEALAKINYIISQHPNSADAYRIRANIYRTMGHNDEANKDLKQTAILDNLRAQKLNDYEKSSGMQAISPDADQTDEETLAVPEVDAALAEAKRETAMESYTQGNDLLNKKDYNRAIDAYNMAIASNPDMAEAYYGRALARFYKSEYPSSLSDLNTADRLHLDPAISATLRKNLSKHIIMPNIPPKG